MAARPGMAGAARPGGDDYQNVWINPNNPQIILLASDQGAIITVNGGATWSSWYNQSTAQLYHVSADNAFPYRLYSGQQESGSVGIASRGPNGEITFRDWHPVGAEEYGYVTADSARSRHRLWRQADPLRSPHRSGAKHSAQAISFRRIPDGANAAGCLFADQPEAFFSSRPTLCGRRRDGGRNWQEISPDLTPQDF